jgi:hypothetical protein
MYIRSWQCFEMFPVNLSIGCEQTGLEEADDHEAITSRARRLAT